MNNTNTALILVGVLVSGLTGSATAQQSFPPYSPTKNELRNQAQLTTEARLGRLEKQVGALEQFLAAQFNGTVEFLAQPEPPAERGTGQEPPQNPLPVKGQTEPGQYHTIQEGETLHEIARIYGVSVDELVAINRLDRYGPIYVGDRLWIPKAVSTTQETVLNQPPGQTSPTVQWTGSHRVCPGDTVHSIARLAGVTPQEIIQQNRLANADQIFVGQVLAVPAAKATEPKADVQSPPPAEEYYYYDVVAGDSLSSIAKTFFTTEGELQKLNGLTGKQIQVDQRIMVPTRLYFEDRRRKKNPVP